MSEEIRGADLSAAAVAVVRSWFAACRSAPGELPADCELVQRRLVRAVGKGELPGGGAAYLKVMAFPRPKDRLRYAFRRLPGQHEARALDLLAARAPDLPCPRPLGVLALRRAGLPWLSALVTRGLDLRPGDPPALAERAAAAARLADAGVEHPDLHGDNFVRLADGRTGVLDLQSARLARGPLRSRARFGMAVKLVESVAADDEIDCLADAGLVGPAELEQVRAVAGRLRVEALVRRIRRCLKESSEFRVRRSVAGTVFLRRAMAASRLTAIPDEAAVQVWIGDRALEILDGCPPTLAGLNRKRAWLLAPSSVYIPPTVSGVEFAERRGQLVGAYRRFLELLVELRRRRRRRSAAK